MADAPPLLIYGDSVRNATLRHELPLAIMDPFLLGVIDGRTHVMVNFLERDRVEEVAPDAVLHDTRDLGFYELLDSGMSRDEMWLELTSRAAAAMGVRKALVDPEMPVLVADRLRADGIELTPDPEAFEARRRAKSDAELAGIRRAQRAAEAGMAAAAELLRRSEPDGDRLRVDGEPLTAEAIRAALRDACAAHGAPAPPDVMVTSGWDGFGHDAGSGPRPAGLPITIDLWPRDEESGCWADMTRTFVVGEVPDEVRELEGIVERGFAAARDAVRPGISGRELHGIVCDVFEAAGYRTQRTGPDPDDPNSGFQFGLGHGVGLEVHEAPSLGRLGREPLVAGDVIAIEPGIYRTGLGEVRFEDLLLVTEDGSETLTDYPYDLAP
ncbi:MAG: M24 family metallopeptidase [Solirubrobacterales bacterium]